MTNVLMIFLQFIIIAIYIFREVRDDITHRTRFIPKYHYDLEYIVQNSEPVIILKLILERSDMPYYIKSILVSNIIFTTKIIDYKINGYSYFDEKNMNFSHKKLIDIHHIIQPLSEKYSDKEIELTVIIPFKIKENRSVKIEFGYSQYPYNSFITIKLPPNNFGTMI